MAERIRKAVESKTYQVNDQTLKVTVTLGVATYPVDVASAPFPPLKVPSLSSNTQPE
jgi:GGDEF domain-containing protein